MATTETNNNNGSPTGSSGPDIMVLSPIKDPDDVELLKKLEEANRVLEEDKKSLQSLSTQHSKSSNLSGHSRKGSSSSLVSANSVASNISNLQYDDESNNPDDLWQIWGKLVNDWDNRIKKKPQVIKDLVRKGIPHHFRGIAWQLLCGAHQSTAKEQYSEYLKQTSPFEKVIRRDITRTYPEHDFFKEKNGLGQESLFNVMKAYSLHDREVGYCQGSGFIVGLLLMQMPEEEAFAVLVQLMQEYRLRELFKPSMAELGLVMFQLECMMQEQLPDLYIHFQSQNFCVSMFASSWFLTLFTTSLPLPVACRIFDVFLSEGMEIIFRVGFAILILSQDELMSMDMEGMLRFLQKTIPARYENDPEALMNSSTQVKYSPKRMKKLEKEYNALKTREQEDQVELRRLRTENRLLRQRIDNLEKETATLADRLIHDQVIRIQKEEEVFVLRRDVSTLKQQHADATQKLEQTSEEFREFKEQESVVASNASFESQQSQEEKIQDLESRMSSMRAREEEATCTVKELRDKVRELESANRQLQKDPSTEMQQLQEELIACKLREAEATLSMKELRQRVTDLEKYWQKQVEKWNNPPEGTAKPNKDKVKQLQEEVMNVRLREAQAFAELTEMKQKVMELETQNQICNRQIKRLDDENEKLKTQLEEADEKEKELRNKVKEVERNLSDIETKRKEDTMMVRIKDAEHSQTVAEMRQRIAELEIENQELVTAGQLQEKGETEALENRISDLQEEVMQLKISKRLQSISSMALNHMSMETESDYDTDDMDTTVIDTHRNLRMTDSIGSMGNPLADIHKLTLKASDLGPDSSDGEGFNEDEGTLKRRTSKKHKMSSKLPAKSLSANGNKSDNSETSDVPHLIGDRDNSDGTKTEGSSSLSSGDLDKKDMESSVESDDLSSNLDGKSSNNVNGAACDTVSADP